MACLSLLRLQDALSGCPMEMWGTRCYRTSFCLLCAVITNKGGSASN